MAANGPTSLSLLQRARAKDQEAWRRLVRIYGPLVYRWCKQAGLQTEDTADVFQEVFRAVAESLDRYQHDASLGKFRGWLKTIARSKIADFFRRRAAQPMAEGGSEARVRLASLAISTPSDNDGDVTETHETDGIARRALELLRPEFAENSWQAFWRVAVDGASTADVAKSLGLTEQAVRQAIYRIRRRLRQELEHLEDPRPSSLFRSARHEDF